ncbi:MAG: ribosomal RNA small subunit methyltransferase A [Deltaproteobacteria bacterium]|nr:ribosomal RNA small subunit methyltransferase A [Deltaproteobacteria bacterium]
MRKHRLRPKKGLGQNFLTDPRTAEKIVAAARIEPHETVVEIGPGLGALTFPLIRTGARIICLETDKSLAAALRERLGRKLMDRVEIVVGDALAFDLTSLPPGVVVVGNLPYQISSPTIFKLLAAGETVDRAVLTLQKEVADRILSPPGPKIYGLISVLIQLRTQIESIMTLPPGAFYPAPKVASRTIRLTFNQPLPEPIVDEALFEKIVRAAFGQRRKTLRQALLNAPLGLDKNQMEEVFNAAGIDPGLRAEKLSPAHYVALANAWDRRLAALTGGAGRCSLHPRHRTEG